MIPDALQGRHFHEIMSADDRDRLAADFWKTPATGETSPAEFRVRAHGGSTVWFEERSTVQRDASGAITGRIGVLRDVTARKKAEQLAVARQAELRRLAARLATAQDEEQRRIAHGLHDDVAQLLTACSIKLAVAQGCSEARELARTHDAIDLLLREANEKIHLLSFELSSSTLYRLGLCEAIEELCEGMQERYGVYFEMEGEEHIEPLDEASATVLFKVVRELLFNVVKHAGVKQATVSVRHDDGTLRIAVEDHGAGFGDRGEDGDPELGKGLGLAGIRERLRDLGGRMRIDSERRSGARVMVWLPLGTDRS